MHRLLRTFRTLAVAALAFLGVASCERPAEDGPQTVVSVDPSKVPAKARFVGVASIGRVYRLEGSGSGEVAFPVPEEARNALLLQTARLFRFDQKAGSWREIAESRYDPKSASLIGERLRPGLYTGFAWSSDPAVNAIQRIFVDTANGYGGFPETGGTAGQAGDGGTAETFDPGEFRRQVLHAWTSFSFGYERDFCQPHDNEGCPADCRRLAGRQRSISGSCPIEASPGVWCEEPDCCSCVTGSVTERFFVPVSIFETLPICGSPLRCPICPNGLSCPTGPFAQVSLIAPTGPAPDYRLLDPLGLGGVRKDAVLRDSFHRLIEETTGQEYPGSPQ